MLAWSAVKNSYFDISCKVALGSHNFRCRINLFGFRWPIYCYSLSFSLSGDHNQTKMLPSLAWFFCFFFHFPPHHFPNGPSLKHDHTGYISMKAIVDSSTGCRTKLKCGPDCVRSQFNWKYDTWKTLEKFTKPKVTIYSAHDEQGSAIKTKIARRHSDWLSFCSERCLCHANVVNNFHQNLKTCLKS